MYPIDTIVTRLQVQKQLRGAQEAPSAASDGDTEYKSPVDAAKKIYKAEGGIKAFYSGLNADVVKHLGDSFLFFLAYTAVRDQALKRQAGKQLHVLEELSVGILAGAFAKVITQPISNIVVRQQTVALVAARDPSSSASPCLSAKDVALQIRSESGIAGFWAGYVAQLILTLNPAITFAADNVLRNLAPRKQREEPSAKFTFLVAALSKVIATSLTYPVMLAKSRAQAPSPSYTPQIPAHIHPREHIVLIGDRDIKTRVHQALRRVIRVVQVQASIFLALRKIYHDEGVAGLYSGLDGEVIKGFLQHGLTMTLKDHVHRGVIQLYFLLLKLARRWEAELTKAEEKAKLLARDVGVKVKEAVV